MEAHFLVYLALNRAGRGRDAGNAADSGKASHRRAWSAGLEDREHRARVRRELARLGDELPPAGRGELVVLRLSIVLRESPLGLVPSALFESVEGDVERAVLDDD